MLICRYKVLMVSLTREVNASADSNVLGFAVLFRLNGLSSYKRNNVITLSPPLLNDVVGSHWEVAVYYLTPEIKSSLHLPTFDGLDVFPLKIGTDWRSFSFITEASSSIFTFHRLKPFSFQALSLFTFPGIFLLCHLHCLDLNLTLRMLIIQVVLLSDS